MTGRLAVPDPVRPGRYQGPEARRADAGTRRDPPRIRDIAPADHGAVAEIYTESIRSGDRTFDTEPMSAADVTRWVEGSSERETILVLERGDLIVGWAAIRRYSDRPGYRGACEKSVYLRRSEIRKGLGTRLQLAVLERCRRYGYHHVVSKVLAVNEGSVAFNERFGFEIVGIQKEIGHINGAWHDIVIMQCVLEDVPPPTARRGR